MVVLVGVAMEIREIKTAVGAYVMIASGGGPPPLNHS
jgi:hypothetical protein